MSEKYNCPNCGAPIGYSDKCEYCGTVLRWTPMISIEYIPKNLHVRQMAVATKISEQDEEVIREIGAARGGDWIIRELSKRLAEEIISEKAFKLTHSFDFRENAHILRMSTYMGVER